MLVAGSLQFRKRTLFDDANLESSWFMVVNPMGPCSYMLSGIYLGLKVVPVSLPLGLCMYYIGASTDWNGSIWKLLNRYSK